MKRTFLLSIGIAILLFNSTPTLSQEKQDRPKYITVTTMHWNMDLEDFDMEEWKSVEKEYLDKVTKKNEHVVGSSFYTHLLTADSREILFVQSFNTWEDIDKAGARGNELAKEAWPDTKTRNAYFKNRDKFYADFHSDEIYATMKGAKLMEGNSDKNLILYIRKGHFKFSEGGSKEEFDSLRKDNLELINNNEFIKAYYPNMHAWGSDKTEFVQAFVIESLSDLDRMFERNGELVKAKWPNEKDRKERGEKFSKYFTGIHGDYLYTYVPELSK